MPITFHQINNSDVTKNAKIMFKKRRKKVCYHISFIFKNPVLMTCTVKQGYMYNKTMVENKTKLKVNLWGYFTGNSNRNERNPLAVKQYL